MGTVARLDAVLLTFLVIGLSQAAERTATTKAGAPDRYCLACLCTAATGCDLGRGCVEDAGRPICGPFFISRPFWMDANVSAAPEFKHLGFRECATDQECSAATVRAYMTKFARDCDGDGAITCSDYGLMHWLGYTGCAHPVQRAAALQTPFLRSFGRCLADVDRLLALGRGTASKPGCQEAENRL